MSKNFIAGHTHDKGGFISLRQGVPTKRETNMFITGGATIEYKSRVVKKFTGVGMSTAGIITDYSFKGLLNIMVKNGVKDEYIYGLLTHYIGAETMILYEKYCT